MLGVSRWGGIPRPSLTPPIPALHPHRACQAVTPSPQKDHQESASPWRCSRPGYHTCRGHRPLPSPFYWPDLARATFEREELRHGYRNGQCAPRFCWPCLPYTGVTDNCGHTPVSYTDVRIQTQVLGLAQESSDPLMALVPPIHRQAEGKQWTIVTR